MDVQRYMRMRGRTHDFCVCCIDFVACKTSVFGLASNLVFGVRVHEIERLARCLRFILKLY